MRCVMAALTVALCVMAALTVALCDGGADCCAV